MLQEVKLLYDSRSNYSVFQTIKLLGTKNEELNILKSNNFSLSVWLMLCKVSHKFSQVSLLVGVLLVLGLNGCSLGNQDNSSHQVNSNEHITQDIKIDAITTIPYNNNSRASEYITISVHNQLNQQVKLQSVEVELNNNRDTLPVKNSYLDAQNCTELLANSNCKLKIMTKILKDSSYLLHLNYTDDNNKTYQVSQVIKGSTSLLKQDGFIYDRNAPKIISAKSSLNVAFRVVNPSSRLEVLLNDQEQPVNCFGTLDESNLLCSVTLKASDLNHDAENKFELASYDVNSRLISYTTLNVAYNAKANIITSGINVVVDPDDGNHPQQIFLYNNGAASAQKIQITAATPISIQNNTCGESLAAAASCSFQINVSESRPSGQSNAVIVYNDGAALQAVYFNVIYISPSSSPALSLIGSGIFTKKLINTSPAYYIITLLNSGTAALTNLQMSNLFPTSIYSGASGTTCVSGQNLAIGASCVVVLSYSPSVVDVGGSFNFIPKLSYTSSSGSELSYANSSLAIPYSAIASAVGPNFVTTGDFGMVLKDYGSNAWTATVNSPFKTATTNSLGIVRNSNDYAMSMSDGTVMYSKSNGLFWKSANNTNLLSNAKCHIRFDGNYYYTCGIQTGAGSGVCATDTRGCVVRSSGSDLATATWAGVYEPSQNVAVNDFYYFNNTGYTAYVASLASTTSNSGLATSSNGTSFTTRSSAFTTAAYNNIDAVVLNTTNNSLTAYSYAAGYSTSANMTNLATWTPNITNRPVASNTNNFISSAIWSNGVYVLTSAYTAAGGKIFTAASATGAYTSIYSDSNPMNEASYGNGVYLAVGNTGKIRTSINSSASSWTLQSDFVVGQATTPNLMSASYESINGDFWITGVSALAKSSNPSTPSTTPWVTPAIVSLAKTGNLYLAVDNQGFIYSSSDLINWTTQVNPSGQILNKIYCSGSLCYAVGNNGTLMKSNDGLNWSVLTSNTSANLYSITCQSQNTGCVAVGGYGSASSGTVIYSNNYLNWTLATSVLATTELNDVIFFNNQYFAIGNGGVIVSSPNGINWVSVPQTLTAVNLNSIACNEALCMLVGNAGIVLTTSTGWAWAAPASGSGTTSDLMAIAYNGSYFQFVGKGNVSSYYNATTLARGAMTNVTTSSPTNNLLAIIPE
ncbi:MAG: hypothetical protein K2Y14_01370 [Burkholderiales bacterium]|nr:hypothetical protein [Burkholderiales bacterium]